MQAVVTDPATAARLRLTDAARPEPAPGQALVKVHAFSLNAGETRTALAATEQYTPGWDFAGVVEEPASDGSGPAKGARVFGVAQQGAWAEYVAADPRFMSDIPDTVGYAEAAAVPVAAVTALAGLESAGTLLGRRVLVTGAAGGVGRYACQLAHLAGAEVFAVSRRSSLPEHLRADGVPVARIFPTITDAKQAGTYDVILDGIGGDSLATALTALAPGGTCITFGNGSGQPVSFFPADFYYTPGVRLQGLWLGNFILAGTNCRPMLTRLIELVAQGRLVPPIHQVQPWTKIADAAQQLTRQGVDGKIVLQVE